MLNIYERMVIWFFPIGYIKLWDELPENDLARTAELA